MSRPDPDEVRPLAHKDLFLADLFAVFLRSLVITFVQLIGVFEFFVLSDSFSDHFVIRHLFLVFVRSLIWHSASWSCNVAAKPMPS